MRNLTHTGLLSTVILYILRNVPEVPGLHGPYEVDDLSFMAELLVGWLVAVERLPDEVVGEGQMLANVLRRPGVEEEVQQTLVAAVETSD